MGNVAGRCVFGNNFARLKVGVEKIEFVLLSYARKTKKEVFLRDKTRNERR